MQSPVVQEIWIKPILNLGAIAVALEVDYPDSAPPCRPARKHKESPPDPPARVATALLALAPLHAMGAGPSASEIHPRAHRAVCSPARRLIVVDASARSLSLEDLLLSDRPRSTRRSASEE